MEEERIIGLAEEYDMDCDEVRAVASLVSSYAFVDEEALDHLVEEICMFWRRKMSLGELTAKILGMHCEDVSLAFTEEQDDEVLEEPEVREIPDVEAYSKGLYQVR